MRIFFIGETASVKLKNQFGSVPNHENYLNRMDTRIRASLLARRGREIFLFFITTPPRGSSSRKGDVIMVPEKRG